MSSADASFDVADAEFQEVVKAWKRQVSPALTCSTAATSSPRQHCHSRSDSKEASHELSDAESLHLPETLPESDDEDDEEQVSRLALSVRRLAMQGARYCPSKVAFRTPPGLSLAQVPEDDEDEEDVENLRLAVRNWAGKGARRA